VPLLLLKSHKSATDSSGWGPRTPKEPKSRSEYRAVQVGPWEDTLLLDSAEKAWGPRLSTEPLSRTASRASGGFATAITDPDNAAFAAWRDKNNPAP